MATLVLVGACGCAFAGTRKSIRYLQVGKANTGGIVVLGQESIVHWRGSRKNVHWKDEDIVVERLRGVLLVGGKEVRLKPVDPIGEEEIANGAFDSEKQRFTVCTYESGERIPARCYFVDVAGVVVSCQFPRGFRLGSALSLAYLYRGGSVLRYSEYEPTTERRYYREVNLDTGLVSDVSDDLARASLAPEPPFIVLGKDKCRPDRKPISPSGTVTVWQCNGVMECRGKSGVRQITLEGMFTGDVVTPVSSPECGAWADAAGSTAWEDGSDIWSHDGRWFYLCGPYQRSGFLVSSDCTRAIQGPCLRVASWAPDDRSIIGVTNCGHEVTEWELPRDTVTGHADN